MTREHDPCAMCANFTVPTNGARTGKCSAWGEKKPWDVQIGVLFKKHATRRRVRGMWPFKPKTKPNGEIMRPIWSACSWTWI